MSIHIKYLGQCLAQSKYLQMLAIKLDVFIEGKKKLIWGCSVC